MLGNRAAGHITLVVPFAALLLAVGCAQDGASQSVTSSSSAAPSATPSPAPSSAKTTSSAPAVASPVVEPPATEMPAATPTTAPPAATPTSTSAAEPGVPQACSDDDLTVTGGAVESTDTARRVVVSFTNSSSGMCTLTGYPEADLVAGAGGVLVHVARRPANAAPRLELLPGEVATADVTTSAVDSTTGDPCGRIGTLVLTPPNLVEAHTLDVYLTICDATISSVG